MDARQRRERENAQLEQLVEQELASLPMVEAQLVEQEPALFQFVVRAQLLERRQMEREPAEPVARNSGGPDSDSSIG